MVTLIGSHTEVIITNLIIHMIILIILFLYSDTIFDLLKTYHIMIHMKTWEGSFVAPFETFQVQKESVGDNHVNLICMRYKILMPLLPSWIMEGYSHIRIFHVIDSCV